MSEDQHRTFDDVANSSWRTWIRALLLVAAAAVVFNFVSHFGAVVATVGGFFRILGSVIAGFVIAYFLNGPVEYLTQKLQTLRTGEKWDGFARGMAILAVYLVALGLLVALGFYLIPLVTQSLIDLLDWVLAQVTYLPVVDGEWVQRILDADESLQLFVDNFTFEDLLPHLTTGFASLTRIAIGIFTGMLNTIVAMVVSVYVLIYKAVILRTSRRVARLWMNDQQLHDSSQRLQQANDLFKRFIWAQSLDAVVLGLLSMLLFLVLNVRFAIVFGVLLGFCNLIPKFGSIFGSLLVIAVTFFTGGLTQMLIVGISLFILQQIDGNVIGPKILGSALKLNPILVLTAVIVGGAYFGVIGMILSIPIAAIIKIIFINMVEARERARAELAN